MIGRKIRIALRLQRTVIEAAPTTFNGTRCVFNHFALDYHDLKSKDF